MVKNQSHIAILLSSFNGARYLTSQLSSYVEQSHKKWSLFASDDGSSDETILILNDFLKRPGITGALFSGPAQGFCANFMSLVTNKTILADYYAFSDQDDVWMADKLEKAVKWLAEIPEDIPALYCSRTTLTDAEGKIIGASPDYKLAPSFANSLLQNIASGNTMIFNHKARELLGLTQGMLMVAHDWSLYQIVSGCGGKVYFDNAPTVLYRQHYNNVIGNSMGLTKRVRNFFQAYGGRAATWNNINFDILERVRSYLTPESVATLQDFKAIRNSSILARLRLMKSSGVYHQQAIGCCTTLAYVLLNKL
jgi:glycosyltransferase involved in cell wall biosynthesis